MGCQKSAAFTGLSSECLWKLAGRIITRIFTLNYSGDVAIYTLSPIELIAGSLPRRQQRLVEAWAELHQSELMVNWHALQSGQSSTSIDALA